MIYRVALLGLLLAACLTGCQQESQEVLFRRAQELANRGDQASLEQAASWAGEAIEADQPTREMYELKALCELRTANHKAARDTTKRALHAFPDSFIAQYIAGKTRYDVGDYAEAIPFLLRATELQPTERNACLLLALAAGRSGHSEAETYFKRLTNFAEFSDDALLYNEWALWRLNAMEDPFGALELLVDAGGMAKPNPVVFLNAAVIYDAHLKKPSVAKRYYMKYQWLAEGSDPETGRLVQARIRKIAHGG
jgi:tetratricopeptide (TPR) repeat protein